MRYFYLFFIFILGLIFGSFVNALEWRFHYNNEASTHKKNDKKLSIVNSRSICPNCQHQLKTLDLIPVVSFFLLGGRCRYCHQKISWQYPLVEILSALVFVFYFVFWPYSLSSKLGIFLLLISLVILVCLIALFIYDLKWYILPTAIIYVLLFLVVLYQVVRYLIKIDSLNHILISSLIGLLIGGGLFLVVYLVSKGQWIGGGDVRLGAVLGLLIGGPLNAFLFLFFGSLLGSVYSLVLLSLGKADKKSLIPFGPFLIIAAVIVQLFSAHISLFIHHYVIY